MSVSAEYLLRCGDETGYPPATLEKVTRLGMLSGAISTHPYLRQALALKGGTALNLCLGGPPPRLSVDLDYNYIAQPERTAMEEERPRVEDALVTLIQRLGFRVQRSPDAFAGRKFFASYPSVFGPDDRVEVDLNYLWRIPLDDVQSVEFWQPGELERPTIRMVSPLELGVGKLLAYLNRTAPRDVWDTARLPGILGETLRGHQFKRTFVALSAMLPHPLHTYSRDVLERRAPSELMAGQLFPMLTENSQLDAAELLEQSWSVAAPFVELTADERAYVDEIHAGTANLELLFPDAPAIAQRLAEHPVIGWKLRNVQQHGTGTGRSNRPKATDDE